MPLRRSHRLTGSRWALATGVVLATVTLAGCHKISSVRCPVPPSRSQSCQASGDPGHVTLRRLSRTEYNNTVRDLLGDATQPANGFPDDDLADGFDNNGDVLTASSLFTEKALAAAQRLADSTWQREMPPSVATLFSWPDLVLTGGAKGPNQYGWEVKNGDRIQTSMTLDQPARISLTISLYSATAPMSLELLVDGQSHGFAQIASSFTLNKTLSLPTPSQLSAGSHAVALVVHSDDGSGSMLIDTTTFQWELHNSPTALDQAHLRVCDPIAEKDCRSRILGQFGRRAWRRPLAADELAELLSLEAAGESASTEASTENRVSEGIRTALAAILASPNFLFRVELDSDLTSCDSHPLEDHELATRLAYTLWASTPDDHLLDVADQCNLQNPDVYSAEIERMLKAPQAVGFGQDFAGQWLKTRNLLVVQPDPQTFPQFDEPLRDAMQGEVEALFADFLTEDRPVQDLLDTDFTFANDRLATHYGLPLPGTSSLVKVPLPTGMLGGLLSRAGILTVNAHPTETSPVRRGAWVLASLLCEPPPPPPPGIPPLPSTGDQGGLTMKERMAAHRANPACASCHAAMDPIGLGLENYDAIGHWRTSDRGEPIDPSGTLLDGRSFKDATGLAELLKQDTRLNSCIAQKLWVYSLGRSTTEQDQALLTALVTKWGQEGNRLGSLVRAQLTHPVFTTRRGGP
jgi:hypothetical protein